MRISNWSSDVCSSDLGLRSPLTMPTTTGKNDRYAEISAFGSSPDSPTAFSTTMIIGAIARIGMVWLDTTHGISERSTARLWTISTARTGQEEPRVGQECDIRC